MSEKEGKIYKIIYIGNENINITYIGSTFDTLRNRWWGHKSNYNTYLNNNKKICSIFKHFDKFGINNFKIFLIKQYDIYDKNQLNAYEQLWINKLKCINEQPAFQPLKKYIKKKCDEEYYQNNKDKIRKKNKEYGEEKIICECGSNIRKDSKLRHLKSKKHLNFSAGNQ